MNKWIWFFVLLPMMVHAQVGINTVAPSATLDVRSQSQSTPTNSDGLLIPKVDVFPATNPTAAQHGMMVFLTTTVGTNLPGFYYWDNPTTSWKGIGNDNSKWGLTGNAGTTPGTDFLGTTDNKDVWFKRNGILSGKIADGNTYFGSGAGLVDGGSLNTYLGTEAGSANTNGQQNVYVGRRAGALGTTGSDNIFIGNGAGILNTANKNVFIGSFSGNANVTGVGNIYVGDFAGASSTGSRNTFIGLGTGSGNGNGTGNVLLGSNTKTVSAGLSNAVAIGTDATVGASNAVVLGGIDGINGATASANIGIGTTTPNAVFDVSAVNKGMLIPRVALASANAQTPVVNPMGTPLPESTMVYNTATAGTAPNHVYPGFYYWNATRWVRFDVDREAVPKYYSAVGTTNASPIASYTLIPEMSVTFTPVADVVMVNFNAAGFSANNSCGQFALFFQLIVDGVPTAGWQTSIENIVNTTDRPIWDISESIPIALQPGVAHTVAVHWMMPSGCSGHPLNNVTTPFTTIAGATYRGVRNLIVMDPNGGAGVTSTTPAVTTDRWSTSGNAGTGSGHFIGTVDDVDLQFRRNNIPSGRISLNNGTAFGHNALVNNTAFGNVAFGSLALFSSTGGLNTAIGQGALSNNLGSENTGVGFLATVSNGADNATAIGSRALVTASNSIVLGSVQGEGSGISDSKVGIGVTAPLAAMHVKRGSSAATPSGNTNFLIESNLNSYQQFLSRSISETGLLFGTEVGSIRSAIIFNNTANIDGLLFRTGGNSNRMGITSAGDVGIGTTAPEAHLEVSGTAEQIARIASTTVSTGTASLDFFRQSAGSFDWRLRNQGGDFLFLRSLDDFATAPAEVYRMAATSFRAQDNVCALGTAGGRWTAVFAVNGVIQTSDGNDKRNVNPLQAGLEQVMALRPVSYQWKDGQVDNNSTHLGFIAQELQQAIPEVVVDADWSEPKEGEARTWQKTPRLGVKYAEITPVLVKAIQEQQATISAQQKEISNLNQKQQQLEAQLARQQQLLQDIANRLQP